MKKILLIFATAVVLIFVVNSFGMDDESEEVAHLYYKAGIEAFEKRELEEAEKSLNKALKHWPAYPEALFKLAETYEQSGKPFDAVVKYQECLKVLKDLKEDKMTFALKRLKKEAKEKLDTVGDFGKEFRRIRGDYIKNLLALGEETYEVKWFVAAQRIFEEVLRVDKGNKTAEEYLRKIDKEKTLVPCLKQTGWTPLFEGKAKRDDWTMVSEFGASFRLEEKQISIESCGREDTAGVLVYDRKDFQEAYAITCDLKIARKSAASVGCICFGIAFGCKSSGNYNMEFTIFPSGKAYGSISKKSVPGKIVDLKGTQSKIDPGDIKDGWNRITLVVKGEHVQGYLNDKKVVDTRLKKTDLSGKIGFRAQNCNLLIEEAKYKDR